MDNTCGKRFDWQLGTLPCGYDHKYTYSHVGYNLKATDMQAALGLSQIEKLPEFIERRKENFAYLKAALKPLEEFLILPQATAAFRPELVWISDWREDGCAVYARPTDEGAGGAEDWDAAAVCGESAAAAGV